MSEAFLRVNMFDSLAREWELEKINFSSIDPSDCISNFVHHMKFSRTNGFGVVPPLDAKKCAATMNIY